MLTTAKERAVIASLKVLPQNAMSRVAGRVFSVRPPTPLNTLAVRAFGLYAGVDFDEVKEPLSSFDSIQSFFTRELKDGARPIDAAPDALVSPCDGAWGQSGTVDGDTVLQVKGRPYSVATLLDDPAAAGRFDGGFYATLYLSPRDYHRFHAPCAGDVVGARYVPGALWPVNGAGVNYVDGLFARNERIVAMLRRKDAPDEVLAMVAVGATMVGKVKVTFDSLTTNEGGQSIARDYSGAPKPLAKGEEWGRFEFGSTLVLVATRGFGSLSASPAGTPLRLGRRIGSLGGAA